MERRFDSLETGTTFYQMSDAYLEHPFVKIEPVKMGNDLECMCGNDEWNAKNNGGAGNAVHLHPDDTIQITPIVRVYGSKAKWRTLWGFETITDADPKDRKDGFEYAKFRTIGDCMLHLHALCHRPAFYDRLVVIR